MERGAGRWKADPGGARRWQSGGGGGTTSQRVAAAPASGRSKGGELRWNGPLRRPAARPLGLWGRGSGALAEQKGQVGVPLRPVSPPGCQRLPSLQQRKCRGNGRGRQVGAGVMQRVRVEAACGDSRGVTAGVCGVCGGAGFSLARRNGGRRGEVDGACVSGPCWGEISCLCCWANCFQVGSRKAKPLEVADRCGGPSAPAGFARDLRLWRQARRTSPRAAPGHVHMAKAREKIEGRSYCRSVSLNG